MSVRLILAAACATLIGFGGSGHATPPNQRAPQDRELTELEEFSSAAGEILGAASMCKGISAARMQEAINQVIEFSRTLATDDDELTSAHDLFLDSQDGAKEAFRHGDIDCAHADAALASLTAALKR